MFCWLYISGYGGGTGDEIDRTIPIGGGGGGGILMIGMRTGRNFNRSIIRTGVRFMTSGGISI